MCMTGMKKEVHISVKFVMNIECHYSHLLSINENMKKNVRVFPFDFWLFSTYFDIRLDQKI